MNGIYIKQLLSFTQSPRLGGGDQGASSYQGKEPSSSYGSSYFQLSRASEKSILTPNKSPEDGDMEPEWEQMVKNIRDKIRSQGDKIEFVYAK